MDKLSWTELRKAIATRINADEKEVALDGGKTVKVEGKGYKTLFE